MIVDLQKDVMMVKGDANEDVIFSRLISYLMASKLWFRKVVFEIYYFSLYLMLFYSPLIQSH